MKDFRKIEHAVLLRYYQLAEESSDLTPAKQIAADLKDWISARRVEVAIDGLVANELLEDEFLPDAIAGWRITRKGMEFVDRQLGKPVSFIARLNQTGFKWLDDGDADRAVISASSDKAVSNSWIDQWEGQEPSLDMPGEEDGGYLEFADNILVAIADEQEPPGLYPIDIEEVAKRNKIPGHATWLKLVGSDLQGRGLGKVVGEGPGYKFLLNGVGLNTANQVRGNTSWAFYPSSPTSLSSDADVAAEAPDWGKRGAILTGVGILVAILIAVVS